MLLEVDEVRSGYHGLEILHGVSLSVEPGEVVAIVGANGAGKSTTLKTIAGEVKQFAGSVKFDGKPISFGGSHQVARRGLMLVPEGRALFGSLTVEDNLKMGAWGARDRSGFSEQEILELFPILEERRDQLADTMSGGQQQMLAIARALMGAPRLLMLDEPSTGLSPKLTWDVFHAVNAIRERGVGVLIVEQNARQVLDLADRAYVLESGLVALSGDSAELANDPRVQAAYLGG
ncbi:ABC transporter ATP-binding protein [Leucobacter aridicollis]|uniref:Branched-chain amino acid transport system ATP-binding protein n=1 Tax=Leucobacter aridicollis TaxID=283878 RepID=A0A852R9U5_9MICO|nr:ABC transporter ATP-binding protein [Leucobacter aridicollis]NYD25670.1 branched-chain amino acid transport system ATP-binding protein [Leucobacter aridicollis]